MGHKRTENLVPRDWFWSLQFDLKELLCKLALDSVKSRAVKDDPNAVEMAPRLKALAAFENDLSSVPSTHIQQFTTMQRQLQRSDAFLVAYRNLGAQTHTDTDTQIKY